MGYFAKCLGWRLMNLLWSRRQIWLYVLGYQSEERNTTILRVHQVKKNHLFKRNKLFL